MYIPIRFSLKEFLRSDVAERAGWVDVPTFSVVYNLSELCRRILDPVAEKFDHPVVVTSGWRSPRLNNAVGGVINSQHITGNAADIRPYINKEITKLWSIIQEMIDNEEIEPDQVIYYRRRGFIHISWDAEPRKQIIIKE